MPKERKRGAGLHHSKKNIRQGRAIVRLMEYVIVHEIKNHFA